MRTNSYMVNNVAGSGYLLQSFETERIIGAFRPVASWQGEVLRAFQGTHTKCDMYYNSWSMKFQGFTGITCQVYNIRFANFPATCEDWNYCVTFRACYEIMFSTRILRELYLYILINMHLPN